MSTFVTYLKKNRWQIKFSATLYSSIKYLLLLHFFDVQTLNRDCESHWSQQAEHNLFFMGVHEKSPYYNNKVHYKLKAVPSNIQNVCSLNSMGLFSPYGLKLAFV